jgi:hypothetical protein
MGERRGLVTHEARIALALHVAGLADAPLPTLLDQEA